MRLTRNIFGEAKTNEAKSGMAEMCWLRLVCEVNTFLSLETVNVLIDI